MKDLKGKLVLITGSSRGLGYAMAEAFAEFGARLIITDLDEGKCKEAAEKIAKDYKVETYFYSLNVAKCDNIRSVFNDVKEKFGKLDVLVNNAGIQIRNASKEFTEEDWDLLMDIDLKGVFFCSQQAARIMERGGSIVNISSVTYLATTPGRTPYCIAKGGVKVLSAALAAEWAPEGIRVNAVAPGFVMTDMVKEGVRLGVVSEKQLLAAIPSKRLAQPKEIADAVIYLASDRASYITGQTLIDDGGLSVLGLPDIEL